MGRGGGGSRCRHPCRRCRRPCRLYRRPCQQGRRRCRPRQGTPAGPPGRRGGARRAARRHLAVTGQCRSCPCPRSAVGARAAKSTPALPCRPAFPPRPWPTAPLRATGASSHLNAVIKHGDAAHDDRPGSDEVGIRPPEGADGADAISGLMRRLCTASNALRFGSSRSRLGRPAVEKTAIRLEGAPEAAGREVHAGSRRRQREHRSALGVRRELDSRDTLHRGRATGCPRRPRRWRPA